MSNLFFLATSGVIFLSGGVKDRISLPFMLKISANKSIFYGLLRNLLMTESCY
jgi:hypothetical protein